MMKIIFINLSYMKIIVKFLFFFGCPSIFLRFNIAQAENCPLIDIPLAAI
jgi:hypothetical protein